MTSGAKRPARALVKKRSKFKFTMPASDVPRKKKEVDVEIHLLILVVKKTDYF
jgi:hypothetical protein